MGKSKANLALVMGGGGARAAYQVGVLRFLARRVPELRIPILTGVSAGAINAVDLANSTSAFPATVAALSAVWQRITVDQVFESGFMAFAGNVTRWARQLLSGGSKIGRAVRGLVDTAPLRRFLDGALETKGGELLGIQENLRRGRLASVAVTTTNYGTGQSITWVQGRYEELWVRPSRRAVATRLTLDHVMASAALPFFFPAVKIGGEWHGDGGIRLTAPLSPALHLGADRVLAVSTRYLRRQEEADAAVTDGYPPPAQVVGVLMNAVFLDMFDYDAENMTRMNQLIREVPHERRGRLRPVEMLVVRPSRDLGKLAGEYETRLPGPFRFMARGLGTRETRSPDFLSMLMFQPEYLERLMTLGEEDAEERADEILAFVDTA